MPATVRDQLASHQSTLLEQIATAANAGDTDALLSLDAELRQTVALLGRYESVAMEARSFLERTPSAQDPRATQMQTADGIGKVAGRGDGIRIRGDFLERASRAGLELRPYHGAIYVAPSGRRVGIAVATERKPERWFLGLSDGMYDAAVLVCVQTSGKVFDICLPKMFLAQHAPYFSRSGGQVKFNVAIRKGHVILKVPTQAAERVDRYISAIDGLDQ